MALALRKNNQILRCSDRKKNIPEQSRNFDLKKCFLEKKSYKPFAIYPDYHKANLECSCFESTSLLCRSRSIDWKNLLVSLENQINLALKASFKR